MRAIARTNLAALVFALTIQVWPASAQDALDNSALNALLTPEPGNKACYRRAYDAAHLREHPRQRVTAVTFILRAQPYDPNEVKAKRPEDRVYYSFAMSVARRGDKRLLRTSGDCMGSDPISCVVDCDGGGLTLDKTPSVITLMIRLNEDGIRMFHDCDEEVGVLVKPGIDDKAFRLDKVSNDSCRALEEKTLGD